MDIGAGAGVMTGRRGVGGAEAGAVTGATADTVSVIGSEAGVRATIGAKAWVKSVIGANMVRIRTVRSTKGAPGAVREADAEIAAAGTTTKSLSASTILPRDAARREGRGRIDGGWDCWGVKLRSTLCDAVRESRDGKRWLLEGSNHLEDSLCVLYNWRDSVS
jgi:hypothetical protein